MTSLQVASSNTHSNSNSNSDLTLSEKYDNDVANANKSQHVNEQRSMGIDSQVADKKNLLPTEILVRETSSVIQDNIKQIDSSPLHPFVFWSQTDTHISIRVDLLQAKEIDISISSSSSPSEGPEQPQIGDLLIFSAVGKGAHGLKTYSFKLKFFSTVEKNPKCHSIERYVLILITKSDPAIHWKRLTVDLVKYPWLRVDFDRYTDSDSDENSEVEAFETNKKAYEQLKESLNKNTLLADSDTQASAQNQDSWSHKLDNILKHQKTEAKDIFDPFNKRLNRLKNRVNMKYDYRNESVMTDNSRNTARNALDIKKTYLFLYNLIMFIMFLKVNLVLLIKGFSGTVDDDIVEGAAFIIKILTYIQLLETIHPMLGLVPGGPLMPFTQVVGRLLVNYFLTDSKIRLNAAPYAQYLFIVWSAIEIFRYSFYALRVFKVNVYFLTWCRYSLFLPLYPMGGFCESMVVFSTIKQFEKTGAFSVNLPNPFNISFKPALALQIYVYLILGPTIYSLMRYMWRQRCKQLNTKDKDV